MAEIEAKTSKINAEVFIGLTLNQKASLDQMLNECRTDSGMIVGSLMQQGDEIKVGFSRLPVELAKQIIKIANDYHGGKSDVNS